MTDEAKFLRAIHEQPEDDTVRLVFADWLQENGLTVKTCPKCRGTGYPPITVADLPAIKERRGPDGRIERYIEKQPLNLKPPPVCSECRGAGTLPDTRARDRAEFLRVQVELARLDNVPLGEIAPGAREELLNRQDALWQSADDWFVTSANDPFFPHRATLSATIWLRHGTDAEYLEGHYSRCALVRRGFYEQVTCSATDWHAHGDALREHHPIRAVRLTTLPAVVLCGWGPGDDDDSLFAVTEAEDGPVPNESFWVALPRYSDVNEPHKTALACLSARWPGVAFTLG